MDRGVDLVIYASFFDAIANKAEPPCMIRQYARDSLENTALTKRQTSLV
ncbi:MAG: hypothetical protein WA902_00790 [Thermosynechococcaceae cyanobacterium]